MPNDLLRSLTTEILGAPIPRRDKDEEERIQKNKADITCLPVPMMVRPSMTRIATPTRLSSPANDRDALGQTNERSPRDQVRGAFLDPQKPKDQRNDS